MPLSYTSISPQYLDYIASTYTRAQIEADPALCYLLEDPYIKDNMELAIRADDAKHGGYEEKHEFVQFLLCNGPELEAHTILHYRNIILKNPELTWIGNNIISSNKSLLDLRTEIYGKTTSKDDGNCFSDPCNYLGPFSNVIGLAGDSRSYHNMRNVYSEMVKNRIKSGSGPTPNADQNIDKNRPLPDTPNQRKLASIYNHLTSNRDV